MFCLSIFLYVEVSSLSWIFFFLVLCFIVNHLATTLMILCFSGDESHVVDTERLSHELKCAIENENIR